MVKSFRTNAFDIEMHFNSLQIYIAYHFDDVHVPEKEALSNSEIKKASRK